MATKTESKAVDDVVLFENDVRASREEKTLVTGITVAIGEVLGGVRAVGTLTFTNTGNDTETITIDGKVYTLQATLTDADGNVHIGASAAATALNLVNAINGHGGTPGTDYANSMRAHPTVTAREGAGDTVVVTAKKHGTAGNAIQTTETSTHCSWGAATLASGADADNLNANGTEPEGRDAIGICLEAVTTAAAGKKIPVLVRDAVVNKSQLTYGSASDTTVVDSVLEDKGIVLRSEP